MRKLIDVKYIVCFVIYQCAAILFTACSNDMDMVDNVIAPTSNDIVRSDSVVMMMHINARKVDFDQNEEEAATRSTASLNAIGTIIYLRFHTSNGIAKGYAVCQGDDDWTLHLSGTMDKGKDMQVEIVYIDSEEQQLQTGDIIDVQDQAIFQDKEGVAFCSEDNQLYLSTLLKPIVGKLLYDIDDINGDSFPWLFHTYNICGISQYDTYNLFSGEFTEVNEYANKIKIHFYHEKENVIYGFLKKNSIIKVLSHYIEGNIRYKYLFSMTCREGFLALGKTGRITIPDIDFESSEENLKWTTGWNCEKVGGYVDPNLDESDSDEFGEWVDLGLPSGNKWCDEAYLKYQATNVCQWAKPWELPTKADYEELLENCRFQWMNNIMFGACGYVIIGPNDNYMYLFPFGRQLTSTGEIVEHRYIGYYPTSDGYMLTFSETEPPHIEKIGPDAYYTLYLIRK